MYAYYRLRSKVNDWESSAFTNQRVKLNLQSFTENLVLKVAKMMQGSVKPSKCTYITYSKNSLSFK
jgi:hypothetical protein